MWVSIVCIFNPDKVFIESHEYFGPDNTDGTEVRNNAMMADCLAVLRTLAS